MPSSRTIGARWVLELKMCHWRRKLQVSSLQRWNKVLQPFPSSCTSTWTWCSGHFILSANCSKKNSLVYDKLIKIKYLDWYLWETVKNNMEEKKSLLLSSELFYCNDGFGCKASGNHSLTHQTDCHWCAQSKSSQCIILWPGVHSNNKESNT